MKNLKILILTIMLMVFGTNQAQVSVNVNIGKPPTWGPVGFNDASYYYLPDVQSYYDVRSSQFIYFGNGKWNRARRLPIAYRNYDLYNGYKVVLTDYRGNAPYTYFKKHKVKYYKGYKGTPQKTLGVRPGKVNKKVYLSNDNDKHDYKQGKSNGKNNGKSHGKNKD